MNTSEHEWNTSEHEWNTSEIEVLIKRLKTLIRLINRPIFTLYEQSKIDSCEDCDVGHGSALAISSYVNNNQLVPVS